MLRHWGEVFGITWAIGSMFFVVFVVFGPAWAEGFDIYLERPFDCSIKKPGVYRCIAQDALASHYELSLSPAAESTSFSLSCSLGLRVTPEKSEQAYAAMDQVFAKQPKLERQGWSGYGLFYVAHPGQGLFQLSCGGQELKAKLGQRTWPSVEIGFALASLAEFEHSTEEACECYAMPDAERFTECVLPRANGSDHVVYINGYRHLGSFDMLMLRQLQNSLWEASHRPSDRVKFEFYYTLFKVLMYGPGSLSGLDQEIYLANAKQSLRRLHEQGTMPKADLENFLDHLEKGRMAQNLLEFRQDLSFIHQLIKAPFDQDEGDFRPKVFALEAQAEDAKRKLKQLSKGFFKKESHDFRGIITEQELLDALLLIEDKLLFLYAVEQKIRDSQIVAAENKAARLLFEQSFTKVSQARNALFDHLEKHHAWYAKLFEVLDDQGPLVVPPYNSDLAQQGERDKKLLRDTMDRLKVAGTQVLVENYIQAFEHLWPAMRARDHAMASNLFSQRKPVLITVGQAHVPGISHYLLNFCQAGRITALE